MKKVFEIKENNKLIQVAWLSSVIYEKGSGYVELEFSPKLKPYMLKLNNVFTKYKLTNILTMKSKYSPRIYEILKCNEFKKQGFIDLEITDLRKLLKSEDIYPRYFDFKKKIIMQSQRELTKKTDIKFTFEEIKTGRKVTAIRFFIEQKHENKDHEEIKNKDIQYTLEDKEDLKFVYMLLSDKLSKNDCNKLYIAAKHDLKKVKRAYELSLKQRQIKNLFAWLKDCIEKEYSTPVAVTNIEENKDTFNDFPQRRYDFEELEARLLGRK
ncbi:replication initiation protein [Clostridium botulinum]|uniref:replication initiation protein n=1 Tax=Clostridium botulinum TaxID=1491 RepID=UPI0006A64D09